MNKSSCIFNFLDMPNNFLYNVNTMVILRNRFQCLEKACF